MAEEKEVILIEVNFDSKGAEKKAEELKNTIGQLKTEQKATQKEFDKGIITQAEYAKSMASIERQLKSATTEQKANNKAIADNDKLQAEQIGSLKRMQVQLDQASDAYRNWNKEQRDSPEGKAALKRIQEFNTEIGNSNKQLSEGKKSVSDYIKGINVMGINIGDTVATFKEGGGGVKAFTSAIFTGRGALIALSAVPIVLFLTTLVSFLKSTDEGADKLEQGLAFLTAAFDGLVKGIAPVGKLLFDLFSHPIDTVTKLTKGTNDYSVSLKGIAAAAYEAGEAHRLYTKRMQDVEDNENALIAQREKVGLQVDQAILKVKDRSLSEKEKIRILREAGKAEAELAELSIKNAKDAYVAKLAENITIQRRRKLTDDEVKAQLEAEAKLVSARRDSLNTQQTIRNRETAQIEEAENKRKAASDKAAKAQKEALERATQSAKDAAQARILDTEVALIIAKRNGEDTLEIEVQLIRRKADLELVGLKKNAQERKAIEAKTEAEIAELRINHLIATAARLNEIEQNGIKTLLTQVKEGTIAELELNKALIRAEANQQKDQATDTIQNKQQLDAQLKRIDAETKQKLEQSEKNFILKVFQIQQQRIDDQQKVSQALLSRFNQDQQARTTLEQEKAAESLALAKEGSKAELDAKLKAIYASRDAAIQAASESGKSREEIEQQFRTINAQAERAASDERIRRRNQEIDKINEGIQAGAQLLSTFYQAQDAQRAKALDDQEQAALNSAGLSAEMREKIQETFDKKREAAEREAAERRKRLAIIEATIQTAVGVAKAIPNPFLIALAAATGIAQIATISAQTFRNGGDIPKLANGGITEGSSHAQGGMKYQIGQHNVELEGGEGVINKRSMGIPWVREMASKLNQIGGGVAFKGTQYAPASVRFDYGGTIPYNSTQIGPGYDEVRRLIASQPPQIVRVMDIRTEVGNTVKVENRADY